MLVLKFHSGSCLSNKTHANYNTIVFLEVSKGLQGARDPTHVSRCLSPTWSEHR